MRRLLFGLSSLLTALLATGSVSAHVGHTTHETPSGPTTGSDLPLALLLSGLLVFGAGLYLAARDDVESRYALVGVGTGLAVLAAGLGLYLRQGF